MVLQYLQEVNIATLTYKNISRQIRDHYDDNVMQTFMTGNRILILYQFQTNKNAAANLTKKRRESQPRVQL